MMRYVKMAMCFAVLALAGSGTSWAQSRAAGANGAAGQSNEGFYPGWTLGVQFEGSTSSDGSIYDLGTAAGYNFSRHFGMDLSVPYYFLGTPTAINTKNPQGVSGTGVGDIGADLKWLYPATGLTYGSTLHLAAPSGDKKKGLSVGHATWDWSNHLDHGFDNFTPFVDAGVGNSVPDTKRFQRPFMTFGYNAAFDAGIEVDPGPLSLSAAAYDVAPWGNQTLVSRVFRCPTGTKCSGTGTTTNRKSYLTNSVSTGGASLTRDNGFEAGVEYKPTAALDLEFDFSRSVPLRLNTYSFSIGVDLAALARRSSKAK